MQTEPLEALWDQYCCQLLAFIRRRVSDEAEAEDLLQEVFTGLLPALLLLQPGRKTSQAGLSRPV